MSDRTLFLHAGGSKSGSSAIQVFLALNAQRLRSLGFSYRDGHTAITDEHAVTSGNGEALFTVLADRRLASARRTRIRQALLAHFSDEHTNAVCSSEHFSLLAYEQWLDLFEVANQQGIKVVVCYYVRNLSPFLSSSYDQSIKRHGLSITWREFLSQITTWEHFQALERLARTPAKDDLRVLSYDNCRGRIVGSFLELLGIAKDFESSLVEHANRRVVNRSLTDTERQILRTLNKQAGDQYSRMLSDILLKSNPNAARDPLRVDDLAIQQLSVKFGGQVAWINTTFFAGEPVVKLVASNSELPCGAPSADDDLGAYKAAFEFLSGIAGTARSAAVSEIADRLLSVDWENADNPRLPEDFDPLGYLLCNRDLLIADVKPYRHYLEYGSREARVWKVERS